MIKTLLALQDIGVRISVISSISVYNFKRLECLAYLREHDEPPIRISLKGGLDSYNNVNINSIGVILTGNIEIWADKLNCDKKHILDSFKQLVDEALRCKEIKVEINEVTELQVTERDTLQYVIQLDQLGITGYWTHNIKHDLDSVNTASTDIWAWLAFAEPLDYDFTVKFPQANIT